jgi:HSP20 family molecular chaperone IbpA
MKKSALLILPFIATLSLNASSLNNDPFFNDPFGDDIFKEMMQMQKQMDKMFEQMHQRMQQRASGLIAPVGTFKMTQKSQFVDKGNRYELLTNIPQSDENNININTKDGMLTINAKIVKEEKQNNKNQVSTFKSVQMYQEALSLPSDADANKITTEYKDNRLVIYIQKKPQAKKHTPNTININGVPQKIKIANTPKKESNTTK